MLRGNTRNKKSYLVLILDGWGIAPSWGGNAISQAKTKTFDKIRQIFPSTTLLASGEAVGLPCNAPGNSEAGHLNIGAGKIVRQDISLIDRNIEDGDFFSNKTLIQAIEHARRYNSKIHLVGMLSTAGTHSHIRHLFALLKFFKQESFRNIFIHLFSDGRDSDPMSGIEMIDIVEKKIEEFGIGTIASVSGRFFSMDRDNRWGRIARTYNMLTKGEGDIFESPKAAFSFAYKYGQTDEFIEPRLIVNKKQEKVLISDNDAVILFNFRNDRVKELTKAFMAEKIDQFPDRNKVKNLFFASFSLYDEDEYSKKVFSPEKILEPIGKIWSSEGLRQLRISESEKFPHVSYFFNGANEKPFLNEERIMIPSPKDVKTYDFKPRMSALSVTSSILNTLNKNRYDVIVANYANADMVGHTGNLEATIQAVECVDYCLGQVLSAVVEKGGIAFVMSDHGNAEQMVNPRTGDPDTEHTTNPVPFVIVSKNDEIKNIKLSGGGVLANIAPTILEVMGIQKPESMINQSLIIKEGLLNERK